MESDNPKAFSLVEIKKLVSLLEESSLSQLKISRGEHRLSLSKLAKVALAPPVPAQPGTPQPAPAEKAGEAEPVNSYAGEPVNSPMVGTFYRASSPTSPNFVEIGSQVEEGQVLCIVEAMKMMNQIKATRSGKVSHVAAGNGQPVEYGQPLLYIH